LFGFTPLAGLLLGIIFMSSSVAVIIPALEETGTIKKKLGRSIVAATIMVDVASLLLLSIVLQNVRPVTELPLVSFYLILSIVLIAFGYGLPRIRNLIPHKKDEKDLFESEVRIIFALLIGTVITFDFLGLHPIIAGFFAGLVLSDSIRSQILVEKLRTLSYGLFIPVFFVVVGFNTDIGVLVAGATPLSFALVVLLGSLLSKYASGVWGARLSGFTKQEARIIGAASMSHLTTALAVAFTAGEFGLFGKELVAIVVVLCFITTIIAPFTLRRAQAG